MRYAQAFFLGIGLTLGAGAAMAQTPPPRLIEEARFGVVREVAGVALPHVTKATNCPAAAQPDPAGPCFTPVMKQVRSDAPLMVVAFTNPPANGARVHGVYGQTYMLYDLQMVEGKLKATPIWRETSEVRVPVGCFELNGERVGYVVEGDLAWQSQYVICDGGPERPTGPYTPEGDVLPGGNNTHHKTESVLLEGTPRWLAYPGTTCEKVYSPRKDYCATEAITYLQQNPTVKEVDLIAARIPVKVGDVLGGSQIDQWVLKRRGKTAFKADSRWNDQFWLRSISGCRAVSGTGWHIIETGTGGMLVIERADGWCGAPAAPVPTETWEAFGTRDYFVVDCAEDRRGWRERRDSQNGSCLDQAGHYLLRTNQSYAFVVVLNERGRVDDFLYPGGYISYDVAKVWFDEQKKLVVERQDYFTPDDVYRSRCWPLSNGPTESQGFVLVRSMGVTFARTYRWMTCPVY